MLLPRGSLPLGKLMLIPPQWLLLGWSFPDLDLDLHPLLVTHKPQWRTYGHMGSCVDFTKMLCLDFRFLQLMECKSQGEKW